MPAINPYDYVRNDPCNRTDRTGAVATTEYTTVYVGKDKSGKCYFEITKAVRYAKRMYEHRNKLAAMRGMFSIATQLEARGIEQALIELAGGVGAGSIIANRINSIAPGTANYAAVSAATSYLLAHLELLDMVLAMCA